MKHRQFIRAAIPLFILAALPAFSGHGRKPISSTTGVIIDDKRFLVEESAGDDLAVLYRELSRHGINILLSGEPSASHPIFADALREVAEPVSPPAFSLPHGFCPERTLRLETGTGAVDLSFGRIEVSYRMAQDRLSASGWESVAREDIPSSTSVATKKKGREITIAFLEENEGKFLFIRRVE